MRWFSVTSVYETVQPFMFLLGCVGLAPFGYRLGMKPVNRYLEFCYVLVYGGMYTYALYSFLFVANVTDFHLSLIIGTIECINLSCQYLTMVFAIVFAWIVKHRISFILQTLHECDVQLSKISSPIDHRKLHLKVSMLAVGIVTSYMLLLAIHLPLILELVPHIEPSLKEILPSAMFGLCFLLQICQFLLFLLVLHDRYCAINQAFRMYFPTSPSAVGNPSEFAICSEKEQINVLKQIKILHDKLNDVVELVNYCFSVQGKRIGILVHKAINCSSSSAVINEVQCCEGANMMLPVCNVPCAWIILILYLSRQLNLFSQQLLHRSPVITCGLFVYDWTLWYTMIGATATYLIILIQFDVSFPNLVNVNATAVYRGST
ncbi:AGAP001117-PF [Anopheles gambiae str. PEST]|uniref:Gustatory receptor n=1 Tax=Anopheles gambiae TaxID=7165 RepID=Q7PKG8_ANOGA|nr:AGAP001117-PF [Anopheles gambiae str. PEST]